MEKSSNRNLKNRLHRMVRDDEGLSENGIPRNKSRRKKETRIDIVDTREPMRFKRGFVTVENKTWKNPTKDDKNCFCLFNQKVTSQEPTRGIQIPSNFKEIVDHKSPVKGKKM